ncbi:MAG: aminodeoxychorismate synthase, component I [Chloroflexi bacterium RBG_13_51_18]|nr:MAG: aminodeoxychorismate synthase, component I [Chloroflexi bacterium RBG_13_51_18]
MKMNYPLIEEIHMAPDATWCFEALAERPFSFFLDSGMDVQKLGRYSFMGSDPFLVMRSRGTEITLIKNGVEEKKQGNPFDVLGELLKTYTFKDRKSEIPFLGGAVGYFSYDLCHFIEKLPKQAKDDLQLPECYLGFYDAIIAFDHMKGKTYLISTGFPELEEKKRQQRAEARLNELRNMIMLAPPPASFEEEKREKRKKLKSNFSHEGYLEAVDRAREYIGAGDIFQVNLSQRLEVEIKTTPYELYKRLRKINPAPFANYFNFGGVSIVGASPERFLKVKGDWVETRPIKGTKPRGETPEEDKALAESLMASKKDRAENIMIVDLERNDIGRVCRYGTVKVTELAILETYPTVFHLTSTVVGQLREGKNIIDLLKATFPGGSITGAPKVRAMEIIDELEPTRRSVYTGSLGCISFSGDMDLNIVIRTFIVKDGKAYFQVGGAIVYDSEPEAEYIETLDKGKALIQALGLAVGKDAEIIS